MVAARGARAVIAAPAVAIIIAAISAACIAASILGLEINQFSILEQFQRDLDVRIHTRSSSSFCLVASVMNRFLAGEPRKRSTERARWLFNLCPVVDGKLRSRIGLPFQVPDRTNLIGEAEAFYLNLVGAVLIELEGRGFIVGIVDDGASGASPAGHSNLEFAIPRLADSLGRPLDRVFPRSRRDLSSRMRDLQRGVLFTRGDRVAGGSRSLVGSTGRESRREDRQTQCQHER